MRCMSCGRCASYRMRSLLVFRTFDLASGDWEQVRRVGRPCSDGNSAKFSGPRLTRAKHRGRDGAESALA